MLALLLLVLAWPKLRTYAQALAILEQLKGKPVPRLLRSSAGMPLRDSNLTLASSAGPIRVRLYTPSPSAPGMVLVPGVHHLGIDEPRLVEFARSIAACGLRVMTPELPDSRDYRIQPSDVQAIGTAAQWLHKATGRRVGLLGISFSGGLALMTAAQAAYARDVSFVFSVGAHDNLFRVASFYTSGADPLPGGNVERATPNPYGPMILEYEHLEDFVPTADVPSLRPVLRAHLHQNAEVEKQRLMTLSHAQKAEYRRLIDTANQDWAVSVSNKRHFAEMSAVSPHNHLEGLRAPVYLLHGRADNLIPFAEAEWLARDLPPGTLQAMTISPLIGHVGIVHEESGPLQKWQLLHLLAQVMERAENPPHE
ncbi:MAG TPA: alpha/beta hydrolase [Acidobacteriaceae bacterium]|nr:alpha/beta hydrolase [Acidobacteriaceae bacterium]